VHALLAGEVSEWPGLDMVAANHDGAPLPVAWRSSLCLVPVHSGCYCRLRLKARSTSQDAVRLM
jgi:hypothetical protein